MTPEEFNHIEAAMGKEWVINIFKREFLGFIHMKQYLTDEHQLDYKVVGTDDIWIQGIKFITVNIKTKESNYTILGFNQTNEEGTKIFNTLKREYRKAKIDRIL